MNQIYHKVWNLWDEHGAVMGLSRLPGEDNRQIRTRILNLGKHPENSTRQGLINALCSAFRYNTYNILDRRVFILSFQPHSTSTFSVLVDNESKPEIHSNQYSSATDGFIVWKDKNGEFTRIIEFINPPPYSRNANTREHNGSKVEITYQYRDGDLVKTHTDKCSPYDEDDESYMGWFHESEGSIKVRALNDEQWITNISNGMKYSDGAPTEKLYAIWREIDNVTPCIWGE